jgi:hypothetical protein
VSSLGVTAAYLQKIKKAHNAHMIEGRILMTEDRLQKLVVEMVALGDRERARDHMYSEVHWVASIWHFGPKDQQLLVNEIVHRYETYEKFFDKPNQSGT